MRQSPQEVEAKFLLNSLALVDQLATAPTLATAFLDDGVAIVDSEDTYYDSADFRLLRHGFGLRIRRQNGACLATLKAQRLARGGDLYTRTEIEQPLPPAATIAQRENWPEALTSALATLLSPDTPLAPICHIRQRRIKRLVRGQPAAAAPPFAELSIDAVGIAADEQSPVLARFHELEIELLGGGDAMALAELAKAVAASLPVTPGQVSKLEHGLQLLSRHPGAAPENWQGIHPEMHMAEACRLIWRDQLTAMLLNEAGVRFSDDPEYIHDMRVAIRRARAAAKLYGGYFHPKAIRRFRKGLRRTAQRLGAVRDLDVAISRLERFAARQGKQSDLQTTLTKWRARRGAAHEKLLAWLSSKRYERFLAEWHAFCTTNGAGVRDFAPRPGEAPAPFQVRHVMPSTILTRFEDLRAFEVLFDKTELPSPETLHQLRIGCKYLRYNLEFVRNLLGERAEPLIEHLRRLQDDLGDLNDAAVSKRMLDAEQDAPLEPGQMRYLRAQERTIERLRRKTVTDFGHFVAPTNRQRLALAIAHI